MALPRAIYREAQLLPLCWLPCAVRFAIWCFRVAKLSAQGSESARLRLQEGEIVESAGIWTAQLQEVGVLLSISGSVLRLPSKRTTLVEMSR